MLERSLVAYQMKVFDCTQEEFWLNPSSNFTLPKTPYSPPSGPTLSLTSPFFKHLPAQGLLLHLVIRTHNRLVK